MLSFLAHFSKKFRYQLLRQVWLNDSEVVAGREAVKAGLFFVSAAFLYASFVFSPANLIISISLLGLGFFTARRWWSISSTVKNSSRYAEIAQAITSTHSEIETYASSAALRDCAEAQLILDRSRAAEAQILKLIRKSTKVSKVTSLDSNLSELEASVEVFKAALLEIQELHGERAKLSQSQKVAALAGATFSLDDLRVAAQEAKVKREEIKGARLELEGYLDTLGPLKVTPSKDLAPNAN